MIGLEINVRPEFTEEFEQHCIDNRLLTGKIYFFDNHQNYPIDGTPEEIQNALDFVKNLESERLEYRKGKSFWWKLFN